MSETPLQDLNAAAGGTPSAADSPGIGLSSVSLSGVPDVEVKGNVSSQATPSTGVVRGIKDMSPEEVQAMNDKIRREAARKYFALRPDAFKNAVEDCKKFLEESDGNFLSSWLLTEIDHWDHERERVVLLTEKMLIVVNYNFIGLNCDQVFKIPLISCDKIQSGRFIYPKNTMMMITNYAENSPRMKQLGIRVHFAHTEPGFFQNWNPFSREMPHVTLMDHPTAQLADAPLDYMKINLFLKAIIDAITAARSANPAMQGVSSLEVSEGEIPIWMYVGLGALIFNQSKLGFCKDRGNIFY